MLCEINVSTGTNIGAFKGNLVSTKADRWHYAQPTKYVLRDIYIDCPKRPRPLQISGTWRPTVLDELTDEIIEETQRAIIELDNGKSRIFDNIEALFDDLDRD